MLSCDFLKIVSLVISLKAPSSKKGALWAPFRSVKLAVQPRFNYSLLALIYNRFFNKRNRFIASLRY